MNWLAELLRRLQFLFRRSKWENDMAEEMRLHLDLRAEEKSGDGVRSPDAESEARRRFGNTTRLQEDSRAAWGWTFWETLAQDIRYACRTLLTHPGFSAAAVLSLALGIGANTAIFGIVNAVMLRSLPVEDPSQLVSLKSASPIFTNPIWEQVRDHQRAFSGVFAYGNNRFDLANGGESRFAEGLWVSGDFFHVLGVPAIRGRVIENSDDVHGGGRSGPVAVISYGFWQSNFAGDPNIIGKTVHLDRRAFQIVGVTPPWFTGLDVDSPYDVAIPIGCEPLLHTDMSALNHRSWWWLRIIGRLKPGETEARAAAIMNALAPEVNRATLPPTWPAAGQKNYLKRSFTLEPSATGFSNTGRRYRKALFTLMALVGLVLLIACANIANLLLARAAARQREISIRLAIGASRSRVIRQLLTESLLLATLGAGGGLLFSIWGARLLVRMISTASDKLQLDVSPDLHVLAFAAAITIVTGLLFGLAPALRGTSFGPNQALKEGARGALAGASRFTLGKALVTVQVALSLTLLVGAGLFLGTLRNLLTEDAGFNRHNVLLVETSVPAAHVPKASRAALFDRILERLERVPGVQSVASSMRTPVSHFFWNDNVHPEGYQAKGNEDDTLVYFNRISPGYFQTLGTPILAGRDFSPRDTLASPKVMIISEFAAHHFWGASNPIGRRIGIDRIGSRGKPDFYEVIGVAKDAKYGDLDEKPLMCAYMASSQDDDPSPRLVYDIRSDGSLDALAPSVRAAIGEVDSDASLQFQSLEVQVNDSIAQQRMVALLSSFFGFLALLLAMIGLYGVISYAAARRRAEIGIRMALGAARGSVIWLVLRDVIAMLAIGAIIGAAASLAAGRLIATLLYGVKPTDPTTLIYAVLLLAAAATIAGYLPARRASRMDPMAALRDE